MRVAFVGKGGSGKSAIAGTFARLLAATGEPVLAIDSDPMPGLAFSLGVPVTDVGLPDEAVTERLEDEEGPRFRLRPGLSAVEAVEQYAAIGPDGVRFLQFGKLRGHVSAVIRSQFAFRQILDELPDTGWSLVGDLAGGTRQPFFGWGDYATTVLVVIEPTAKSTLAARRLNGLTETNETPQRLVAVANKVRQRADIELVQRRTGLHVIGTVPWDERFAAAERAGRAPIDDVPAGPAVRAVQSIVSNLVEEDNP